LITVLLAFLATYFSVLMLLVYLENAENMDDPKPTRFPSIDVLIPAYNEEDHIAETISSILSLEYPGKKRIIVINDGSKDSTLAIARRIAESSPEVVVIDKQNGGKASALNDGLKIANAELVAVLDADSIVMSDALLKMVGHFDDPEIAAVTPMMKVWRTKTPLQVLQRAEYILNSFMKKLFEQFDAITVTPGPFSVYRRSVFDAIGGFDEETITEDQEIAFRIQKANYRIASSYGAVVYTDAPAELGELYKQRNRWYRGSLENIWKHRALIHPDYGDLGLFVIPATLAFTAVGIFTVLYTAYSTFEQPLGFLFAMQNFGAPQVIFALATLASFTLTFLATRRLGEGNPIIMFALMSILSPMLAIFWFLILIDAAKDILLGVRVKWKGS